MIESIEGSAAMPRLRPPYVAEVGLVLAAPPWSITGNPCGGCETCRRNESAPGLATGSKRGRNGRRGCSFGQRSGGKTPGWSSPMPASPCVNWSTNIVAACCPVTNCTATFRAALRAASCRPARRRAARFRYLGTLRLLHRLCRHRGVPRSTIALRPRRKCHAVLRPRILRTMHPCRVGTVKVAVLMAAPRWDALCWKRLAVR